MLNKAIRKKTFDSRKFVIIVIEISSAKSNEETCAVAARIQK